MKKEQIDWQAYRKGLVSSLSNERLWSLGCNSEENFHLENIADLEDEIEAIDRGDFDMILEKHEEFPELFDDSCFLIRTFPLLSVIILVKTNKHQKRNGRIGKHQRKHATSERFGKAHG